MVELALLVPLVILVVADALQEGVDHEVKLEARCADDGGLGDPASVKDYEETREGYMRLEALAADVPGVHVRWYDCDDKYSRHADCYIEFPVSKLREAVELISAAEVEGDILDVPGDFPPDLQQWIEHNLYWEVERH